MKVVKETRIGESRVAFSFPLEVLMAIVQFFYPPERLALRNVSHAFRAAVDMFPRQMANMRRVIQDRDSNTMNFTRTESFLFPSHFKLFRERAREVCCRTNPFVANMSTSNTCNWCIAVQRSSNGEPFTSWKRVILSALKSCAWLPPATIHGLYGGLVLTTPKFAANQGLTLLARLGGDFNSSLFSPVAAFIAQDHTLLLDRQVWQTLRQLGAEAMAQVLGCVFRNPSVVISDFVKDTLASASQKASLKRRIIETALLQEIISTRDTTPDTIAAVRTRLAEGCFVLDVESIKLEQTRQCLVEVASEWTTSHTNLALQQRIYQSTHKLGSMARQHDDIVASMTIDRVDISLQRSRLAASIQAEKYEIKADADKCAQRRRNREAMSRDQREKADRTLANEFLRKENSSLKAQLLVLQMEKQMAQRGEKPIVDTKMANTYLREENAKLRKLMEK
jgi:hypothetical protein